MKGRSSSKPVIPTEGIEAETISGTYIRSLVKHLTSSTRSSGTKEHAQNVSKDGQSSSNANQTHPPPQPQRKKVRRRLHTSRPYQENLLNMAEARREIVAALKCHRASMKQQEAEKQQKQAVQQVSIHHESFGLDEKIVFSRRNPRIYSPRTDTQSDQNCLESLSYSSLSHFPPSLSYNSSCSFSFGGNSSMDICPDILDVTLPSQTLGLNLNLQEFDILDSTYLYHQNRNNQSSLSYFSSSYSPPTTEEVIPSGEGTSSPGIDFGGGGFFHSVTNNEVMEEMRSIGEQHQMEWDDNMNLVTSSWWFKFSKSMEVDTQEIKAEDTNDVCQYHLLDQMMEFPSWINANEACLLQPLNGYCSVDKFQESSLPCMDLGEFEATDVEWLS